MKRLIIPLLLSLALSSFPARAHETDVPHEEIRPETPAPSAENASVTQPEKINIRPPPALRPLLLVPLALGLYLIYEKLSGRK